MTVYPNADQSSEQEQISFNNSTVTEADFQALAKGFILKTTANVYIAFDRPANTGDFLLASTDTVVEFDIPATRVSALGASGSGTLYIIARR